MTTETHSCSAVLTTMATILVHLKIHVMILRLTPHTESSRLDAWENDAYQFSKACWVERRHTFVPTFRCIMREHSISWHRATAFMTYCTQPNNISFNVSFNIFLILPDHGKYLLRFLRPRSSFFCKHCVGNVPERTALVFLVESP